MTGWLRRLDDGVLALILALVGLAAGGASFTHMHDWTMANSPAGTPDWFGWANACISDLVPVAALLKIRRARHGGNAMTYPLCLLAGFSALSLAAQVAVAVPSVSGWLLSAVPAIAFMALTKLVLRSGTAEPALSLAAPERPAPTSDLSADPWERALPVAVQAPKHEDPSRRGATDDPVAAVPAVQAAPRTRPKVLTSGPAVREAAAAAALPGTATIAEIAARAKVSESTVRRHLPESDPRRQRGTGQMPKGSGGELAAV